MSETARQALIQRLRDYPRRDWRDDEKDLMLQAADALDAADAQIAALTQEREALTQDAQLVRDLRADYISEYSKQAMEACEHCGSVVMCGFHSLLSQIFVGSPTDAALMRRRRGEGA